MYFRNRDDAAQKLIPYLRKYRDEFGNEKCVILAIPRGGIPIACPIAKTYNMPMDLLMTKKIGHPLQKEFAIGAVSLEDHIIDDMLDVPASYVGSEVTRIRESLRERYKTFMNDQAPVDLKDKVLIIVDDGVATGNTILSAIAMLRKKEPAKIVVAVPLSSYDAAKKIREKVDDFICLYIPEPFVGVGLHYMDFKEVSDEEVKQLIRDADHFEDAA